MLKLKWKPSDGGYVESVSGLYQIEPQFNGRIRACAYSVYYIRGTTRERIPHFAATLRDAKQIAQHHNDRLEVK